MFEWLKKYLGADRPYVDTGEPGTEAHNKAMAESKPLESLDTSSSYDRERIKSMSRDQLIDEINDNDDLQQDTTLQAHAMRRAEELAKPNSGTPHDWDDWQDYQHNQHYPTRTAGKDSASVAEGPSAKE